MTKEEKKQESKPTTSNLNNNNFSGETAQNQPEFKNQTQNGNKESRTSQQPKKKIIKKFPFKQSKVHQAEDDQLKDWKPTQIGKDKGLLVNSSHASQQGKKKQIASQFFSMLPKPKTVINEQKSPLNDDFGMKNTKKVHKPIFKEIISQKSQWDADDQFLHKNIPAFQSKYIQPQIRDQNQKEAHLLQQKNNDQLQVIERIEWINEEKNKKQKNLAQLISKTWENQQFGLGNQLDSDSDSNENLAKQKKVKSKLNVFPFRK